MNIKNHLTFSKLLLYILKKPINKTILKRWVLTLGSWLLGTLKRTELSFIFFFGGGEGYKGWPGMRAADLLE